MNSDAITTLVFIGTMFAAYVMAIGFTVWKWGWMIGTVIALGSMWFLYKYMMMLCMLFVMTYMFGSLGSIKPASV